MLMMCRALSDVMLHYRTVSQHVPKVMYHLGVIPRVVPTARFREERISNQRAHQGSEPNEEVKRLQKRKTKARHLTP